METETKITREHQSPSVLLELKWKGYIGSWVYGSRSDWFLVTDFFLSYYGYLLQKEFRCIAQEGKSILLIVGVVVKIYNLGILIVRFALFSYFSLSGWLSVTLSFSFALWLFFFFFFSLCCQPLFFYLSIYKSLSQLACLSLLIKKKKVMIKAIVYIVINK